MKQNPYVSVDSLAVPEFTSLYRAARYLAFAEKILCESDARLIYSERCKYLCSNHNVYIDFGDFNWNDMNDNILEWNTEKEREKFDFACDAIMLWLKNGDITARGVAMLDYRYELNEVDEIARISARYKHQNDTAVSSINREFWNEVFEISWLNGEVLALVSNPNAYKDIQISTKQLEISALGSLGQLEQLSSVSKKRGRPAGSERLNDDVELGYMYAQITKNGESIFSAAKKAVENFGVKGASFESHVDRLRSKYSQRFKAGD